MGSGCSTSVVNESEQSETPPRPVYQACDLVGLAVFEKVQLSSIDGFFEQAAQFSQGLCELNDAVNGLLLDVRLATGLLQGGISTALIPSPNVDIFSVELLTSDGRPLDVAEAARLRGRDLAAHGNLAACDKQLARCVEELSDFFVKNVGSKPPALSLSAQGTLVPRSSGEKLHPAVEAFNQAMLDMRTALGSDYLLALHLHKAQAHGAPSFRVRLLKPTSSPPPQSPQQSPPPPTFQSAPAALPTTTTTSQPRPLPIAGTLPASFTSTSTTTTTTAAAAAAGPSPLPPPAVFWEPVTLLDQASCPNASQLHDALHAFHDANGRLAAAMRAAGLTGWDALMLASPRFVRLAGGATPTASTAPTTSSTAATAASAAVALSSSASPHGHNRHHRHHNHHHNHRNPTTTTTTSAAAAAAAAHSAAAAAAAVPSNKPTAPTPSSYPHTTTTTSSTAAAAAAVRSLPSATRVRLSYAVAALNSALHRLASAAAGAAGPASFAALLTHVLGELRERVAGAAGERALESYRPSIHFTRGGTVAAVGPNGTATSNGPNGQPPLHPLTVSLTLDARLGELVRIAPGAAGQGGLGLGTAAAAARGSGRQQQQQQSLPPFPDCLSPPIRHAWLLLQELLRLHNATVGQLGPLRQLAEDFQEGARLRLASVAGDAAASRLPPHRSVAVRAAVARNLEELGACCQGALRTLTATAGVLAGELAEAAQLASVQCAFMSPLAWSVSVASSLEGLTAAATAAAATGSSSASAGGGSSLPSLYDTMHSMLAASAGGGGSSPGSSAANTFFGSGNGGNGGNKDCDDGDGNDNTEEEVELTPLLPHYPTGTGDGGVPCTATATSVGSPATSGSGSDRYPAPSSPPDVVLRPDQQQQHQRAPQLPLLPQFVPVTSSYSPQPAGTTPPPRRMLSTKAPDTGKPSGTGGGGGGGDATAKGSSRTPQRSYTIGGASTGRETGSAGSSGGGWMPLNGGGGATAREGSSAELAPLTATATRVKVLSGGGGGEGRTDRRQGTVASEPRAGESLAEEYARTALAHLNLQPVW
ncbi:hypothetical protein Agub_g15067 [Astrephomene gubernaculifera]|uniref:Uncharacterized protein n=1 Tax=Astrephomene gubernaculifera TaxID=47775 RepID=A0AAD3E4K0_9CHLO|nr:hypothetical protein Agub_g15067 [Astrephomene gubernaculifera]